MRRKWSFGGATFDEAAWTLTVDGCLVPVEAKPLALLHELLVRAGEMVPKEALMESVWPDVIVSEASLTTAMRKLRRAVGDEQRDQRMIQTVSGVGYRLVVPVKVEFISEPVPLTELPRSPEIMTGSGAVSRYPAIPVRPTVDRHRWMAGLAVAVICGLAAMVTNQVLASRTAPVAMQADRTEILAALRRMDLEKIEQLNQAGWDPNQTITIDGNAALHVALEICEWNPDHDQEKLLVMVRMLYDGGARIERSNKWGDTAYSIAKAERYCGLRHPVTRMMYKHCFLDHNPIGDKCLATYEIEKREKARRVTR